MKRLFYIFVFFLVSVAAFAGAGLWHSNITLTINGSKSTYYISQNSDFSSEKKIESSYTLTGNKSITINSIRMDVWKDGSGNICGGKYTISVGSISQIINPSWKSDNGNNQVWEYSETKNLDLSLLEPGEYTLTISGYAEGNSNSSSGCNSKFQDNTLSCKIIIPELPKPNNPEITSFSVDNPVIDLGQSVTFNVEVENADEGDVVFKNGNTTIFNPWTPTEGGVYTITATLDGATSKTLDITVYAATIYFDNTNSEWSNVYAYCWDEGGSDNKAWPGVKLTNPVGNVYTYKSTKVYQMVVFNAGQDQPQTADLEFVNGEIYSMPKPIPVVAGTANLCGTAWDASSEENKMEEVDSIFSKVYSDLPAGEYEFKVVYEGEWYGLDKVNQNESTKGLEGKGNDGKNIGFHLIEETDVTITFDLANKKITIVATGVDKFGYVYFSVGDTIYFSSDKGASNYAAYFYGPGDKYKWVDLEQKYKNIYTIEVPDGEWDGLIYCELNTGTTKDWNNVKSQTEDLKNKGKNWYFWKKEGDSFWRNFENLIFAGEKLYFKPDSNWESAGARFAAYYWDIVGENRWADCVYKAENDVYEVTAPMVNDTVGEDIFEIVWTNLNFLRMNPDFEDNGWNKGDEKENGKPERVWNQTADLTYDGINDLFVIKLSKKEDSDELDWNLADINNWISFDNCFKDFIFFKPNEAVKQNRFSVWLWNGFGEGCWVKYEHLTGYEGFYYVAIPEGFWTGANICCMNPDNFDDRWENKSLQTNNLTYHSNKLLYKAPNGWTEKSIADECWCDLEREIEFNPEVLLEINEGLDNGAYYQAKKFTMEIPGAEVTKWHWISLPYDVNVADIKSNKAADPYGVDFIMKRYDTANRAAWEGEQPPVNDKTWVQLTKDDVLKAGRGYILGANTSLVDGVTLTFPSVGKFHLVTDQVDAVNENIEAETPELNVNSNWHLIGTGLYGATQSSSDVNFVAYPDASGSDYTYHYLGEDVEHNYFDPTQTSASTLGMYKAFFVQYGGEYSFSKAANVVKNMAPRRAKEDNVVEHYYINIANEVDTTHTAIFMAEDGTDEYVVGQDFLHFGVTGKTMQVYSTQNSRNLSFNYLKNSDCSVNLGGYVLEKGEYCLSAKANGRALVKLVDNVTGAEVDLLHDKYRFIADKGSLDNRFTIVFSYVEEELPTDIIAGEENSLVVLQESEGVVVEGLSIGENVWVYDISGQCVNNFVVKNEKVYIDLSVGVYVLKTVEKSVKFIVW